MVAATLQPLSCLIGVSMSVENALLRQKDYQLYLAGSSGGNWMRFKCLINNEIWGERIRHSQRFESKCWKSKKISIPSITGNQMSNCHGHLIQIFEEPFIYIATQRSLFLTILCCCHESGSFCGMYDWLVESVGRLMAMLENQKARLAYN